MPPVVDDPLFFLDYDGTLAPIVDDPDAAVPHPDVPGLLRTLDAQYPVRIVTGRDLHALAPFLDQPLRAIGLHGAQRGIIGEDVEQFMSEEAAQALDRLHTSVPAMDGIEIEQKGQSFAVHYRGVDRVSEAEARLERWLDDLPDVLDVIWGKKVVELRPSGLTKGTAVQRVVGEHPARAPVYLGDDTTDEDAFAVLQDLDREVVTVRVGEEDTCADYRLTGPEEVVTYLRRYVPS